MERLQVARSELTELERLAAEQRERKEQQGFRPHVARGVRKSIANLKGEISRLTRDALYVPSPSAGSLDDDLNSGSAALRNSGAAPRKIAHVPMEPHERDVVINKDSNAQDTYDLFSTLPIGSIVHFADKDTVDGKLYQYTLINNSDGRGPFFFKEVGMDKPRQVSINPLNRMPENTFDIRVPASTISAACSSKNPMVNTTAARRAAAMPHNSIEPRFTEPEDLLRGGFVTLNFETSLQDFERIIGEVEKNGSRVVYEDEDGRRHVSTITINARGNGYLQLAIKDEGSRSVDRFMYTDTFVGEILVPNSASKSDSQSKTPKKMHPSVTM